MFSVNPENSSDITPRPAYFLVKALANLFADSAAFTPGSLSYNLTGSTSNVVSTLFQRSNGTFYLTMWLNLAPWNANAGGTGQSDPGAYQTITPQLVSLSVNASQIAQYSLNATDGTVVKSQLEMNGNSVSLSITDTPLVVEIVMPDSGTTTGASTGNSGASTGSTTGDSDSSIGSGIQ